MRAAAFIAAALFAQAPEVDTLTAIETTANDARAQADAAALDAAQAAEDAARLQRDLEAEALAAYTRIRAIEERLDRIERRLGIAP